MAINKKPRPKVNPLTFRIFGAQPRKFDLKRAQIVEAAIYCLATLGVEETSLDSIGKRMKMARSHLIYYFQDRAAIFEAAIHAIIASGQDWAIQSIESASTPRQKLIDFAEATFRWADANPNEARVLLLFFYSSGVNPKMKDLNRQMRESGHARILALLQDIPEISPFTAKDKSAMASRIQCLMTGYFYQWIAADLDATVDGIRKRVREAVLKQLTQS